MDMNRYEKDIFDNKNLDAPSDVVLEKARSAMRDEKPRRKLNAKHIFAIVSACVTALVVILCIPVMMPANSEMKYIINADLQMVEIDSVERYNEAQHTNILHFAASEASCAYTYQGKTMFLEETSSIDGVHVVLLVEIVSNTMNYNFEKPKEYTSKLPGALPYSVADKTFFRAEYDDEMYLSLNYGDYIYYMKLTGEIANWQNILEKFSN